MIDMPQHYKRMSHPVKLTVNYLGNIESSNQYRQRQQLQINLVHLYSKEKEQIVSTVLHFQKF